ncbi:MAG: adenylosuccinate lyase [Natronomonas sp.]
MTQVDSLFAVSPLDGRYRRYTEGLAGHVSEAALMRGRVEIEVEYLLALAELEATPLSFEPETEETLRALYEEFDAEDAAVIKQLETEGYGGYAATNHDVKAIEYFLRMHLPDEDRQGPWVHFGLTSEDVNNLAYRLLVRSAIEAELLPAIREVRAELLELTHEYGDLPMLSRTHGQPATPTTFGKETAVYASRLGRAMGRIEAAIDDLSGKVAGASGTYAAHVAAYPEVEWDAFAREFVESLGFEHEPLTTQVNPCDDLAALFDALTAVNNVLCDANLDMWLYVSDRYLGQAAERGETGSSTMPHKVNPIDFENSEGNLSKANSDLRFLADYVTTSRLQRDLSDSTVKRNIGAAFAHCLIGYEKATAGLSKVTPNERVMREDLEDNPEVIGEAVQTILRREGDTEAYERIKELTRGRRATLEDFRELFAELDIDDSVRAELNALTPAEYVGIAAKLARRPDERDKAAGEEY